MSKKFIDYIDIFLFPPFDKQGVDTGENMFLTVSHEFGHDVMFIAQNLLFGREGACHN